MTGARRRSTIVEGVRRRKSSAAVAEEQQTHTGVEAPDGAKDPALVRAFVEESRRAFALLKRNGTAS